MGQVLLTTCDILFPLLILLVFARVILSWLPQYRSSQIGVIIMDLSEPIMRPFQNLLPRTGMMDFTPMVATIALWIIWQIVDTVIATVFNL